MKVLKTFGAANREDVVKTWASKWRYIRFGDYPSASEQTTDNRELI